MKELGYAGTDSSYAVGTAVQSVVAINCVFDQYLTTPALPDAKPEEITYSGAGVIYEIDKEAGDALIVTNYHVVYEAGSVGMRPSRTFPTTSASISTGSFMSISTSRRNMWAARWITTLPSSASKAASA